jgi:RHS repeat-associated protein
MNYSLPIKKIGSRLGLLLLALSLCGATMAMTVTIFGNTTVCQGSTASFTAQVTNYTGTLTYQWKKNGVNVTGQTGPPPYVLVLTTVNNGDVITCVVTSTGSGSATSNALTMTVTSAQTFSASVGVNTIYFCQGASATFTANSSYQLTSYQWQMNGSNVSGQTSSSFTTTVSSVAQLQSIRVLVTTNASCVTSTSATGSAQNIPFVVNPVVTPSISISSNAGTSICSGNSVTFTASVANGGTGPGYQWRINGADVPGANGSTFTTSSLTNGQQVTCYLTSAASCATPVSVLSNTLTMTVNTPQTMTATVSGSGSVCQGSTASFSVGVSGATGNLTYQWKRNGANVSSDITGPPPYVLVLNTVNNNDVISCVVSSDAACVSPVSSNNFTVTVNQPQTFTAGVGISTLYFCQGDNATFTANSSYSLTSYQWQINGGNVPGATSSSFTTAVSSVAQLQSIRVLVTTNAGCVTSTSATGSAQNIPFVVNPIVTPGISISSGSGTSICAGSSVTFTASPVNGGSNPGYQWMLNGVAIPGANGSTYITSGLVDGSSISCTLTSNASCVTTNTATSNTLYMTVGGTGPMGVTVIGPSTSICQGSEAYFTATASNYSGTLTFHWKKNGADISSDVVGPPPYVLARTDINNNDVISCVITADNGCAASATSNNVTATVIQREVFTVYPNPQTIYFCQDGPITFTASSNFGTTGVYQWQMNGLPVDGVTGNTFSTTVKSVGQLQSVTVSATASGGCISNPTATGSDANIPFVINPVLDPGVSFTQSPVPALEGSPITFTAVPVNGGYSPTYEWKLNGDVVAGVTGDTYTPTITTGPEVQTVSVTMNTTYACPSHPTAGSGDVYVTLASAFWENINYIRVHSILVTGVKDWITADQLPIGQKDQTTSYLDGLGRPIQKVDKEAGTPSTGGGQWLDLVQPAEYDEAGRMPKQYLPYSTATEPGKFKTTAVTEQASYYALNFNESPAYGQAAYDGSPLGRVTNSKAPGAAWNASNGHTFSYDITDESDNVRIWSIGYNSTDYPVTSGTYPAGSLFKNINTDDKGRQTIEYMDNVGHLILKKQQLDDNPAGSHAGWICLYNVYDDYGQLRYVIQPEAVKYLDANGWTFDGNAGQQVLDGLCFRYEYDEKGRMVLKKSPGAKELYMVYDLRDRVIFTQDGNQRSNGMSQWQVTFYDQLDRTVLTALYNTTRSRQTLQADANSASALSSVITTPDAAIRVYGNAVSAADIGDASKLTTLHYNFFDNYDYAGAKSFDNNFTNGNAYSTADPNVLPIAVSGRVNYLPTGTKTRVLGTNNFLMSTQYYDEGGNAIQSIDDNITGAADVVTRQYHFCGRLLSEDVDHSATGTLYSHYHVLTKNLYDERWRASGIQKKFGSANLTDIAQYTYNDLGRASSRRLAPGYTGSGKSELETLTYSYNLHGDLTGINKDYALKTPGKYDKWGNYFGMYLGYDNGDGLFAKAQLDGHIAGAIWSTQGDDMQRKYDYDYDNAGRLINASFSQKQQLSDSWSNSKVDLSVTGINGKIEYDLNSNIMTMMQKGIVPGQSAPVIVDDLRYSYAPYSNKLSKIYDNGNLGALNGKLGDFKDGSNGGAGSGDDYVFDDNGNMITDLNKEIKELGGITNGKGISYNFLDKPEWVRIEGKGVIQFVYYASGNKVQKIYTPDGGTAAITNYADAFVYENGNLQYINFEEGRLRVIQSVATGGSGTPDMLSIDGNLDLPGGKRGVMDFYVKDHLGNIRMILTEESHTGRNTCTMEPGRQTIEESLFGQVDANGTPTNDNEVKARFPVSSIPGQGVSGGGWTNPAIESYVSRLSNLTKKIGPNSLLKVMAGDKISAQTIYYYQTPTGPDNTGTTIVNDALLSLGMAIAGSGVTSPLAKGAAGNLSGLSNVTPFTDLVQHAPAGDNIPRAFLYVLFFDEQFNFIAEGSTSRQVSSSPDGVTPLIIDNVPAPKNGYAFVYVGNESDAMVYFDNLQVTHSHSPLIEENHYYAYGLRIAGISSRKLGDVNYEGQLENSYLYNGKELLDDGDLDWYDYGYRSYDAQIGRFIQLDPYADEYPEFTPYQYASAEPIANIDLDGLEAVVPIEIIQEAKQVAAVPVQAAEKSRSIWEILRENPILKAVNTTVWHAFLFAGAAANTIISNHAFGAGRLDVNSEEMMNQYSFAERLTIRSGQVLGDVISIIAGLGEIGGGASGEIASIGIATPVAIPLIMYGGSVIGTAVFHILKDLGDPVKPVAESSSSSSSSSGSSEKPPAPDKPAEGINTMKKPPRPNGPTYKNYDWELHHFLTNKGKVWPKKFKALLKKYGRGKLDLDGPWNKKYVPQNGSHPKEYHEWVYKQTERALKETQGQVLDNFLTKFYKYVIKPVEEHPEMLDKSYWQKLKK